MKQAQDMYGRDLNVGDYVLYCVKGSTSAKVRIGRVHAIHWTEDAPHSPYSLTVIATKKRFNWSKPRDARYVTHAYKTVLHVNSTLVVLPVNAVPEEIQEVIRTYGR